MHSSNGLDKPQSSSKGMPEAVKKEIGCWRSTPEEGERQLYCPHFIILITDYRRYRVVNLGRTAKELNCGGLTAGARIYEAHSRGVGVEEPTIPTP